MTEYINSGPIPSPGIRVHVVRPSGFDTGACCKEMESRISIVILSHLILQLWSDKMDRITFSKTRNRITQLGQRHSKYIFQIQSVK